MQDISTMDSLKSTVIGWVEDWYIANQANLAESDREVVAFAGLIVAERLRRSFPIPRSSYWTDVGNRGAWTAKQVQDILTTFGERRRILSEAGRTTGSSPVIAHALAELLNQSPEIAALDPDGRTQLADAIQERLTRVVTELFDQRKRMAITVDINLSTTAIVSSILAQSGKRYGAIAQHLVGAKLAIRHRPSGLEIENHSYTAGDLQTERPGDFLVGSFVYHVTAKPGRKLIEKCEENVRNGYRPYVLVPAKETDNASELARQAGVATRVTIDDIETFVGRNVDEISAAESASIKATLFDLLTTYNQRAELVESDVSVLLDIPAFLKR